jgi:hypothetical protein
MTMPALQGEANSCYDSAVQLYNRLLDGCTGYDRYDVSICVMDKFQASGR